MTATPTRSVVSDSASTAKWTLVSRITGFGRVLLVAAVLGPTFVGNLFQLANQLPWLVFEITVGSLLGSLLVPALMNRVGGSAHHANEDAAPDLEAVGRLAGTFVTGVMAVFGGVSLAVMILSPLVARLFALGVPDDVHDQLVSAALPLILLTAPQVLGYGLTVTLQSVQQAMGSYALPAAAGMVENVVVILALAIYGLSFGSNTAVGEFDTPRLLVLGLGSSAGVLAHVLLQWWGVRRLGLRLPLSIDWSQPEVREVARRALPAIGTAALNGVRVLALMVLANSVAGGVVALQMALNLLGVAVALGAKPVAYAMLPRLAVQFRAGDLAGFRESYERSVGLAALIAIPAAVGAASLGWLLGPALAFGAMDNSDGRELLTFTVTAISIAVLGEALHQLAVAGSYGRNDARSPLAAYVIRLAVTLLVLPFLWNLDGAAKVLAITLAMGLGDFVSGFILHRLVGRPLPPVASSDYLLSRSLFRTIGSAALGFGGAAVAAMFVTPSITGRPFEILAMAVVGLIGLAVTLFVRRRLDTELASLIRQLRGSTV